MGEQGATLTCCLVLSQAQAPCVCRANVEGPSCDRCKPGFWGLSPSNPEGCTRECALEGVLGYRDSLGDCTHECILEGVLGYRGSWGG